MKKLLPLLTLLALPLHAAGIPISGRVLTPEGKPAPGVRALLIPELPSFEIARLELAGKAGPAPAASASTDAEGSFRLTAPDAGMWTVRVEAAGFVPLVTPLLPLTEEAELADVRLVPDAGLQVKVTDPWGKPAGNAWVRVEGPRTAPLAAEPWQVPLRRVAFTDANGGVTLPRTAGETLTVWAAAPGSLPARQETVHGGAVSLRLAAGAVRGVEVRDGQGKGVAGVLIALRDSSWVAGRTAESGRLDLALPAAAGVDLRLVMEDGRRLDSRVRAAKPGEQTEEKKPAVVVLPPAVPVSGRVVAERDGRPLPGALVWLDRDLGALTRAGADGTFRLAHLPEETRVFATAPGYFAAEGRATGGRLAPFTLQPRLTAKGIVVDEAGRPVAGAGLKASPLPNPAMQNPAVWGSGGFARSAPSGRFQLSTLAAGVAYELRVQREGFAPGRVEMPARAAGAPGPEVRVVLRAGRAAFGTVIDGQRRPVAGAQVSLRLTPSTDLRTRVREARDPVRFPVVTSDAAGRFEVRGLPAGTFDLTVRARGFAPLTVPALAVPAGKEAADLGTVMLAPGGAIHGMVTTAQGEPVADAEVQVRGGSRDVMTFLAGDKDLSKAVTAADGSFALEDLSPGVALDLIVTHPGYGPGAAPGVAVPSETPVHIVLQPTSSVSGHVTGPDGKPVAGATVELNESARGMASFRLDSRHAHKGATDEEGSFAFEDVAPGPFQLSAEAPRHQQALLRGLEVKPGQDLSGVEIVLPAGAAVEGKVLSPEGRPVADADVMVAQASRGGYFFSPLRGGTSAEGRYRIEGISPGPHTLEVYAEGYRRAVRDFEAGPETRQVDFQLDRAQGEVSGRVIDDAGNPVPGTDVMLYGTAHTSNSAESGADGSFRLLNVEDGTYRLRAYKQGYAPARLERELTVAGAPVTGVEVRLTSADGAIKGRLTGLAFSQLSRVRVRAEGSMQFARVDADGNYQIDHLPPATWTVSATVPDTPLRAEGSVTLEPGVPEARLDLRFGGGHELSGAVLRNGEPLAAAGVLLTKPGGEETQRASTDHQGGFRFGGLDDGGYLLSVRTPNGAWHQERVEITGDQTVQVELHTSPLSGRVIDAADSSPVAGARVLLRGQDDGDAGVSFSSDATTDARGVFHLPEVGEGAWTVQASREGYAPGERKIQVEGDAPPGDVEIRLDPTEGVTVEALLATGQPPDRLHVAVLDGAGATVVTGVYPTGENGRTRIANAPPGSWLLLVEAARSAPATVAVSVPGPAVHVILPPAGRIRLQVPALKEPPIAAKAVLTGPGGLFRDFDGDSAVRAEWDLEGGFWIFDRVPPGVWQVGVRAADGRSWNGTATVTAGAEAVVELR